MAKPPITTQYMIVKAMAADLVEAARRDMIQVAVLLVTRRFGKEAGDWLLKEMTSKKNYPV